MDSAWAGVVTAALDEVRYGIVLLDRGLTARFINRAFYAMWSLPPPAPGTAYHFTDLMAHGQRTGAYAIAPDAVQDYVDQRISLVRAGSQPAMQLRLADGRILSFECLALPDGGRMLTYSDVTDLVHTVDQLRELATVDDLTKLLNRRQFLASFDAEFGRSVREDRPLTVLMLDADDFKKINDRLGHPAGDAVLRTLAERCRSVLRQSDIVGRVGGEEFAAALFDSDLRDGVRTAERLRRIVERDPVEIAGTKVAITVSLGVAARAMALRQSQELLRQADKALYEAKAAGRNRVIAFRG